jgi:RimJ/RimL family protein N-acetyltransferase
MRPVERRPLVGGYVRLEPLSTAHETDLRGIDDPALFRFLPQTPDDFPDWFASALTSRDPLYFAAVMDGVAVGRASVMRMDLPNGVAEIGNILWGPRMQHTPASTEAVFLLADRLFGLGARRVEWKCNDLNEASKSAAERLGFTFEGVFRQHMIVKGHNRDTAWFSLLDHEWPARRRAILAWLREDNFVQGQQRQPLQR